MRDFIGGLLLLFVSVVFTIASFQTPFNTTNWVWYTSPTIFALAMAVFLGICSLWVTVRGLRVWLKGRPTAAPADWKAGLRAWGMKRFLAAVAIVVVYLLLLGRVPFPVASVALIVTFGTVFRKGRFLDALRPAIIASLVVVVFSYVIMKVFGIIFP
jgi:hypothetical protein